MQQGPGDLFVVRNAGNIVPPHGVAPGGVSASIEYAVAVLGVPDIVICGHSGCGAMTAILNGREQLKALPEVARWLNFANAATQVIEEQHAHKDEAAKLDILVRENVLAQLVNLLTHPAVANAIASKASAVAWMGVRYSYGDGDDLQCRGGGVCSADTRLICWREILTATHHSSRRRRGTIQILAVRRQINRDDIEPDRDHFRML